MKFLHQAEMEIYEKGEIFLEKDDDFVFDHTKILLEGTDGNLYCAKTKQRMAQVSNIPIDALDIKCVSEDIWPLVNPSHTRAPDPLPPSAYFKRPRLLYYDENSDPQNHAGPILTEIEACEVLRSHPHPNIAQYFGCVVQEGKIRGLAFARYSVTLSQMLKVESIFDKDHILRGIEAGVRHLHALGLIHNDLNPSNIMMDGDNPVIIDFDSCRREGEELGCKSGTPGWTLDGQEHARRENDLYSLSKIRAVLTGEKSADTESSFCT